MDIAMVSKRLILFGMLVLMVTQLAAVGCSDTGGFDDQDAGVTQSDASDTRDTGGDVAADTAADAAGCSDCEAAGLVCDEAAGECVACLSDVDCTELDAPRCNTERNECVACVQDSQCGEGVCDVASGECLECGNDDHCTEATASQCGENNTCEGCTDDSHCNSVVGTGTCDTDTGICIECTLEDNSACDGGANSCDPATNTCTDTPLGSVGSCGACKADSECIADHRCVPMEFDGQPLPDGYCLPIRPEGGCPTDPFKMTTTRESVSGHPSDDYCGIDESRMSCAAITDHLSRDKTCTDDSECGLAGQSDGDCVSELGYCSYPCTNDGDCPGACGATACEQPPL